MLSRTNRNAHGFESAERQEMLGMWRNAHRITARPTAHNSVVSWLGTDHCESGGRCSVARRSERDGREPAAEPDCAAPANAAETPSMKPKLYQLPLLCTS